MSAFINISVYKFAPLADLPELRLRLLQLTKAHSLRGTILLSPEGINLFMAGSPEGVEMLLTALRQRPGLETLTAKYSESAHQPFTRLLVRLKKEIIAFGVDGIDPAGRPTAKLPARTLKQWLDEGRPVTLLDTRNDYEVRLGTFRGALPAGIGHFRDFPAAVAKLPAALKQQPIVMFCTGGIRCEKSTALLRARGFDDIHHLHGGILRYLETVPADQSRWNGECFVFDGRVAVGHGLAPGTHELCHACRMPVSAEDRASPLYVPGISCPHCHDERSDAQRAGYAERERQVARAAELGIAHLGDRDG